VPAVARLRYRGFLATKEASTKSGGLSKSDGDVKEEDETMFVPRRTSSVRLGAGKN
jgi:hypothetical protein